MTLSYAVGNVIYMVAKPRLKPDTRPQTDAQRLRAIYDLRKSQLGFDQEGAGKAMGISQTLVSHYLTGHKPLGVEALLRWAKFLQVSPLDISPSFEYREMFQGNLNPTQIEVALLWAELPEDIARNLRDQMKATVRAVKGR